MTPDAAPLNAINWGMCAALRWIQRSHWSCTLLFQAFNTVQGDGAACYRSTKLRWISPVWTSSSIPGKYLHAGRRKYCWRFDFPIWQDCLRISTESQRHDRSVETSLYRWISLAIVQSRIRHTFISFVFHWTRVTFSKSCSFQSVFPLRPPEGASSIGRN